MRTRLYNDEDAVTDGRANLQRGWEAVGGHLYLTNQRLIFEAHEINVQTQTTVIPLTRIARVCKCWTKIFGLIPLIPNSVLIETTDDVEFRFVLFGRQAWIDAIEDEMALARGPKEAKSRRRELRDDD